MPGQYFAPQYRPQALLDDSASITRLLEGSSPFLTADVMYFESSERHLLCHPPSGTCAPPNLPVGASWLRGLPRVRARCSWRVSQHPVIAFSRTISAHCPEGGLQLRMAPTECVCSGLLPRSLDWLQESIAPDLCSLSMAFDSIRPKVPHPGGTSCHRGSGRPPHVMRV